MAPTPVTGVASKPPAPVAPPPPPPPCDEFGPRDSSFRDTVHADIENPAVDLESFRMALMAELGTMFARHEAWLEAKFVWLAGEHNSQMEVLNMASGKRGSRNEYLQSPPASQVHHIKSSGETSGPEISHASSRLETPVWRAQDKQLEAHSPQKVGIRQFLNSATLFSIEKDDQNKKLRALVKGEKNARDVPNSAKRRAVHKIVHSVQFEAFFSAIIFTNAFFMGLEVEFSARSSGSNPPDAFTYVNFAYTALFLLELILRIFADGRSFLCSGDWAWNLFDAFLVSTALLETSLAVVRMVDNAETQNIENMSNLRIVRILRVTRMARTLRISRIIRFVTALRTLVLSIALTLKELVWALLLLAMITYSFGVLFTMGVTEYFSDAGNWNPQLDEFWGSLPVSMLTLFKSVAGGISWHEVVEPLREVSIVYVFTFLAFVFFIYFAVLNVVTGVFCQSAMETAQTDPEIAVQSMLTSRTNFAAKLRQLFGSVDKDGSGHITLQELEDMMANDSLQAYLSVLGLDVNDAWEIFRLIDDNQNDVIEVDEFIRGVLCLKGSAKSIDLRAMMEDHKWLRTRLAAFMSYVEHQLSGASCVKVPSGQQTVPEPFA